MNAPPKDQMFEKEDSKSVSTQITTKHQLNSGEFGSQKSMNNVNSQDFTERDSSIQASPARQNQDLIDAKIERFEAEINPLETIETQTQLEKQPLKQKLMNSNILFEKNPYLDINNSSNQNEGSRQESERKMIESKMA